VEVEDTIKSLLFDCQCVVFLIDITNSKSIDKFERLYEKIIFSDFSYLNIIVVENKIDLNREISEDKIKDFMEKNKIEDNMKISVKEGTGVEELSKKIKEYLNKTGNDMPINFSSQIIDEYSNDNIETLKKKEMKTINIIFLGNSAVGKTCLFLRLNKNYFKESFLSTIGVDRITKTFKYKNEIYKINIVDTAGQDRYRTLPAKYYINADGVFLLFDLTDKQSFNDLSLWMKELNKHIGNPGENKKGPVVYLLGNKLDKLDRVITTDEAEEKANFYDIKYFEISCKLNINIQEVYSRMVVECSKNVTIKSSQSSFQVKTEKKKTKKKANICC
jgi:Ras-related protein Rab-1A